MARGPMFIEVKDVAGNIVTGAIVTVVNRATGLKPTIYQGETGATALGNPMAVDSLGRAVGWLDRGDYLATVQGTGITSYQVPLDIAPAGDRDIDVLWGPTAWFPTVGSTLPALPWGDGDRFVYSSGAANYSPVELRYRLATGKWEYMGGGGFAENTVGGTRTLSSNVWADTTTGWTTGTAMSSYTIPFSGEYEITMYISGMNGSASVYLGLGPVVNNVVPPVEQAFQTTPAAAQQGTVMFTVRKTLVVGDVVEPWVINNGTATFTRQSQGTQIIPRSVS